MKMYILSDRSGTLAGMRLAGIEGSLVKDGEEFSRFIDSADFSDIAILLVTRSLAQMNEPLFMRLKQQNRPITIEVPDRENCSDESDSVTRYVRDAMGIKL